MGLYQLSNYLLVCEPTFAGVECGRELRIEQVRSERAAADEAIGQGWHVSPPGFGDSWTAMCDICWAAFSADRSAYFRWMKAKSAG